MKPTDNLNLPPVITVGSSGLDPVRGGISPEQSLYTVIRSYNKSLGDELNIEVGDKAVILENILMAGVKLGWFVWAKIIIITNYLWISAWFPKCVYKNLSKLGRNQNIL